MDIESHPLSFVTQSELCTTKKIVGIKQNRVLTNFLCIFLLWHKSHFYGGVSPRVAGTFITDVNRFTQRLTHLNICTLIRGSFAGSRLPVS